ncbi:MAG TPA: NADH-quinone oxidoreductase subunit N [Actinomycetota bacterium]|nr:NADH-quinone oxidoreductase subunit N [Actinomycetota bacterium]
MRIDYAAIGPEIALAAGLSLVLMVDLALRGRSRVLAGWLSFATLVVAAALLVPNHGRLPVQTLGHMFVLDGFAFVFKALMLGSAAIVVLLSIHPMRAHRYEGEYYFLMLCAVLGTVLMPSSRDLLMLFVALELVSVPGFVLAGIRKRNARSNEAAVKFFLFGVLSAGIFVYGISLIYGFAGTTDLARIAQTSRVAGAEPLLLVGVLFIVGAFGFKVSAVPFHFWAPDTYEGSPTPLAAFLSVSSKAAGFVGLMLLLLVGVPNLAGLWGPVVGGLAIATMTVGNVLALRQRHLVRLLAYSSIGQAGYMLIPLALIRPYSTDPMAGSNAGLVRGLAMYLLVYAVMNLGAFAVVIGLSKQYPTLLIRDIAGLSRRAPFHAAALAGFMLSLGGIPPLAGWAAKFFVFLAAMGVGSTMAVVLAAVMVVNSVISLYYYVGVARAMYLQVPEEVGAVRFPPLITAVVAICIIGTLVLGVFPEPFASFARSAGITIFQS